MSKDFNYINGVTIAICRRLVNFAFGPDRVINVKKNKTEITYDIYLKELLNGEKVDPESVEWFNECWGKQFRIFTIAVTEISEDSDTEVVHPS